MLKWKREGYSRLSLMGKTPAEVRDIMIEGESGILACSPPWDYPKYEPSKRRLVWDDGTIAMVYSGENFEQSRGGQHEKIWIDELAKYQYPQDALDNMMFGLRLGDNPQCIITTTPKPIKTIKELIKDSDTHITRGSTYDNIGNLADAFIKTVVKKYEGTRLGRQELHAEVLDDNPNALWKRSDIDDYRVAKAPNLVRVVVAIDPAVTSEEDSDETGIIVAGIDNEGHGYLLQDVSCKESPDGWATKAVRAYYRHDGDRIIGEANNGGDMIGFTISTVDRNVPYRKVWASKGKYTRAEPIAALYEQGRIHHVGNFSELEDELCEWQAGMASPNRLDAAVWAFTELFIKQNTGPVDVNI